MGYSVVDIAGIEAATGGAMRSCAASSASRRSGSTGSERSPRNAGSSDNERETQQEEVNVVVRGSGVFRVDGEACRSPPSLPRSIPETVRQITAGPDGLTMVAVGARRGGYWPRGPF